VVGVSAARGAGAGERGAGGTDHDAMSARARLDLLCGTTHLRRHGADRLIASLDRNARLDWRLWLADVTPVEEPVYAPGHPRVAVVREWPRLGISAGYNRMAGFAGPRGAEYVGWLNDDVEVEPGWDAAAVAALEADPAAGMAASYHLDPRAHGWNVREFPVGLLYANFGILSWGLFRQVGGFDDRVWTYGCDNALSFRVQGAGRYVLPVPASRVVHHAVDDAARRAYMGRNDVMRRDDQWLVVLREWHQRFERLRVVQSSAPARPLTLPESAADGARVGRTPPA